MSLPSLSIPLPTHSEFRTQKAKKFSSYVIIRGEWGERLNSIKWEERKGGKEAEREKEREKGERERE